MVTPFLVVNSIIVAGLLVAGVLALLSNSRSAQNRLFFGFVTTVSIWIFANYFSNNFEISQSQALLANHLTLLMPGIVLVLLLNFALILSNKRPTSGVWLAVSGIGLLISGTALTSLVVGGIRRQGNVYAIDFGTVGTLYFLNLLLLMALVTVVLATGRKRAQGQERQRIQAVLLGVSALLGINLATNALLPALGGSFVLTNFGPLSAVFVVIALWYSIIRHKLLDIRLVVARSLAYALSLATIAGMFLVAAYTFGELLFQDQAVGINSLTVVYTCLTLVIALMYPSLKRFFDHNTNRLFYRDAYDPQTLFDQLNKVLVSSLDIELLMRESSNLLTTHLKPEFCLIGIQSAAGFRLVGSRKKLMSAGDISLIRDLAPHVRASVIIADTLDTRHQELRKLMEHNNLAVLVRLTPHVRNNSGSLGYIMFGEKKSGNPYSPGDVRTLESVANELVIAAQNALHYEEIQRFNLLLQQKVDEATHKLRRTNEKLKALDEAKDDFVSMASHQLRTPLTSIKGYTSMVLEGDAGKINETQRQLLEQSFSSAQRMVYLIADLLNVSRLKTGKFIIEQAPVNLADVVESEIGQLKAAAAGRSLELAYEHPGTFPSLLLDETKTRQVIMNFVDNAIYYTPAGGHIVVKLIETPSSVEFRVSDDGIGVPKSEQPHLFTKFYRAGNARKARPDGTGLGLFMAKKVIVAEGGSILFETTEGKGSTFGFIFSKAKLAPNSTPVK